MAGIDIKILPEFSAIGAAERKATVVVELTPPPAPRARPAARIVMALDVSGSMTGEKMRTAVASAQALVRSLGPADSFACVSFADRVQTLVPPLSTNASGKAIACEKLASAHPDGSTDLAAAALAALKIANEAPEGGRALLLTDGCPTVGVIDGDQIVALAKGATGRSTLSTFGFGRDVDAPILSGLADVGKGNYTFIETGEPPMQAIGAELGGMLLTVAADVSLTLHPSPGVKIDRVFRPDGVSTDEKTGAVTIALPPLIAEEPVYVAVELSWVETASIKSLALVTTRGRLTRDGSLHIQEAHVVLETLTSRGAPNPDAIREIIIARAAVLLDQMSRGQTPPYKEAIQELTEKLGELGGVAQAAGLENDAQVSAALAMIRSAREAFEKNAAGAQQDMVASAAALKRKRSTYTGVGTNLPYGTFVTRSQVLGAKLIVDNQGAPDPKASPNQPGQGPSGNQNRLNDDDDPGPNSRR
ncbi:MAG: VWA domain-containing protein [Polyangiaceae bacterium]